MTGSYDFHSIKEGNHHTQTHTSTRNDTSTTKRREMMLRYMTRVPAETRFMGSLGDSRFLSVDEQPHYIFPCSPLCTQGDHLLKGTKPGRLVTLTKNRANGSLGAKPLEAIYAYTICSGQMHFRDVFIDDIWCTFRLMQSLLPRHPYSSKNSLNLCKSHEPPWPR